jgi:hypothetical protein
MHKLDFTHCKVFRSRAALGFVIEEITGMGALKFLLEDMKDFNAIHQMLSLDFYMRNPDTNPMKNYIEKFMKSIK